MTDRDNPCVVCGSTDENFDPKYCSKDCYERRTGNSIRNESVTKIPDLRVSARKNGFGWVGRVAFYEDGKYVWSRRTAHARLTKEDALKDARREVEWISSGGAY